MNVATDGPTFEALLRRLVREAVREELAALPPVKPEQLLDTAIVKLRTLEAARPQAAPTQAVRPLSIPMVRTPHPSKRGQR